MVGEPHVGHEEHGFGALQLLEYVIWRVHAQGGSRKRSRAQCKAHERLWLVQGPLCPLIARLKLVGARILGQVDASTRPQESPGRDAAAPPPRSHLGGLVGAGAQNGVLYLHRTHTEATHNQGGLPTQKNPLPASAPAPAPAFTPTSVRLRLPHPLHQSPSLCVRLRLPAHRIRLQPTTPSSVPTPCALEQPASEAGAGGWMG